MEGLAVCEKKRSLIQIHHEANKGARAINDKTSGADRERARTEKGPNTHPRSHTAVLNDEISSGEKERFSGNTAIEYDLVCGEPPVRAPCVW